MKVFWNNAVSDNFSNTTDWSTGSVPGPADIAVITAPGVYTVTADSSPTVLGINTGSGATLAIPGTFIATAGTVLGANRGTIAVNDDGTLEVGGTFNNIGEISLASLGDPTNLQFTRDTTLNGGGTIAMTDSSGNTIGSLNYNSDTLTNVDNTIAGAGSIGGYNNSTGVYEYITLVNEKLGVVDATGVNNQLQINGSVTNSGLLEATGAAEGLCRSTAGRTRGYFVRLGTSKQW